MVRKLSLLGGVRYMSFDPHPREGAMQSRMGNSLSRSFNPRPLNCRHLVFVGFNPRPREGAMLAKSTFTFFGRVSIRAPVKGRCPMHQHFLCFCRFNPRPREGAIRGLLNKPR